MMFRLHPFLLVALISVAWAPRSGRAADEHDHQEEPRTATAAAPDGHDDHDDHEDTHDEHEGHDAHADEVTLTPEAIRRYGIRTHPAGRRKLTATFAAPGRVAFNTEAMAHVGSVLTGRITDMKVRLGDTVAEGDELFVIESPELAEAQSDFLQRRTAVTVAEAALEPVRLAYERAKALHDKHEGIALAEVQKREAEWRAAQGALATAKAALAAAENKLHVMGLDHKAVESLVQTGAVSPRSPVRAPLAGQVVEREVTLGELVNPDRDALLVLADLGTLWVVADVPESRLAGVEVGSKARVQIAATPQNAVNGTVTYISPTLNPETRTAGVRVEVPNEKGVLRPGMFARVELSAAQQNADEEAVLVVPEEAVQTVEGEPSVFVPVEGEPNTFAKRAVKVGKPVGGMVPVLAGLEEGQPVVTSGTFILKADLGKSGASHEH
jgi:membrane fusion protein, heavy metal efflux system